ncbi:MAG: flagellar hook-length control protein FliK, partial [Alcaligenaceae bacterium]|nr:flagellar hook-length control protein FliK [Alcaligenaceae bacterium]
GPALTGAAPLAPATAMPGLMPAGMLPGQAPGLATPGAGIRAPLGSPQWPTELGRQFISIAQAPNNLGKIAELRLDPPELGPLRITINLNDNVAHAVFSSPHALVRQTVENALPQLQQMLEQAGISLGQANVNDQHSSGQASQDPASQGHQHALASGASEAAGELAEAGSAPARPSNPNALVDTFV